MMESMSLAVLAKRNCTACCHQVTKAMLLFPQTSYYLFSPYSIVLLEKLTGHQVVKKSPHFTVQYSMHTCPSPVPVPSELVAVLVHIPLPEDPS